MISPTKAITLLDVLTRLLRAHCGERPVELWQVVRSQDHQYVAQDTGPGRAIIAVRAACQELALLDMGDLSELAGATVTRINQQLLGEHLKDLGERA